MSGYQAVVVDGHGSNFEVGRQHAKATTHLLPQVHAWVQAQLADHPLTPNTEERLAEVERSWERLTPGTLAQLRGMAEVYDLPVKSLLVAVLGTYLRSLDRSTGATDGCTTFAVAQPQPLLVKNRDNDPRFLGMQTVLRVSPETGYRWMALSTAGAPGVHSSGMNEVGLCVADTHVPATDIGPGVPRFGSMMHLLERCRTTKEAVTYLLTTPQMGLGNLTLVDARGDTAVVECGFRRSMVRCGAAGPSVATNHYLTESMAGCLLEPELGTPGMDTRARFARVMEAVLPDGASRGLGLEAARQLAAWHGSEGEEETSLCEHGPGETSETISTTIYDPILLKMHLAIGRPCTAHFSEIPLHPA